MLARERRTRPRASSRSPRRRARSGAAAARRPQIESSLTGIDGGTRVDIVTDLTLSGAVAQYGRGIVQDVSGQLVSRFADCLKAQLAASTSGTEEAAAEAAEAVAEQTKPVSGISLGVGAFLRSIGRMFGRVFGKSPKTH